MSGKPSWQQVGGWWYYGREGVGRSGCWTLWREFDQSGRPDGSWTACAPNTPRDWEYPNFPDLETAKAWVEIEASNHG